MSQPLPFSMQSAMLSRPPYKVDQTIWVRHEIKSEDDSIVVHSFSSLARANTFPSSPIVLKKEETFSWAAGYRVTAFGETVVGKGRLIWEKNGNPAEVELEGVWVRVDPQWEIQCLDVEPFSGMESEPIRRLSLAIQKNGPGNGQRLELEFGESRRVIGGPCLPIHAGDAMTLFSVWVWGTEDLTVLLKDGEENVVAQKTVFLTGRKEKRLPWTSLKSPLERRLFDSRGKEVREKNVSYIVRPNNKYALSIRPKDADGKSGKDVKIREIVFKEDPRILFVQQGRSDDQQFEYEVHIAFSPVLTSRVVIPFEVRYEDGITTSQTISFWIHADGWTLSLASVSFGLPFALDMILSPIWEHMTLHFRIGISCAMILVLVFLLLGYDKFWRGRQH